jgi:hypothetical protein
MEYAKPLNHEICDNNYMKYVGYQENNECIKEYFSKRTIRIISNKVTELLMGVDPQNRPIIVPDQTICNIMSNIQENFRPETGDIYTRYIIVNTNGSSLVQDMINQVIEVIVSDVRTNLGMEEYNSKLTKWTTLLGDFNPHGLRSHAPIKLRKKRPMPMQIHMHY